MTPAEEAEVVRKHQPFVMKHALRAARTSNREIDDCVQDGNIAFLAACRKWTPEGGANIRTFATPMMQASATRAWRAGKARKREGVEISLDAEVETEEGTVLRIELATFATPPTQEADLFAKLDAELLHAALKCLTPRRRDVIERRFFKGEDLAEVGEAWGVCRERARQIEVEALVRLRAALVALGIER